MGTDQTLAAFLDPWLAFVEPLRSPTTIRGYRDKVRRWKAALGARKVSKLTAQDLDRTYSRWLEEGSAPQTVQHCHRVLTTALTQAQRWGLINRYVTDLARPPASIHRPPPELDAATWEALVLDLKDREPVTAMAVLLAGVTGARRGELCGLRWSDIDETRRQLTIARSIRTVSTSSSFKLRFHDLRHMSASLLIGAGTDVRTVAGRLGHADASTTLRIYAHAFEAPDLRRSGDRHPGRMNGRRPRTRVGVDDVNMSRARETAHVHVVADNVYQAVEDLTWDWSREGRQTWAIDTGTPDNQLRHPSKSKPTSSPQVPCGQSSGGLDSKLNEPP